MVGSNGSDSLDTGRFGFNNRARNRRQAIDANDLLADRSIGRKKLSGDCFPPNITPDPEDARAPSWHAEHDKIAHENGSDDHAARGDHNHDYTYARVATTRVKGSDDADYTSPFSNAEEGPSPLAGPTQYHMRTAVWDVAYDAMERIALGPTEVWTRTSLDGGTTWDDFRLRCVVPPGVSQAYYEVLDYDYDPATYAAVPTVEVYPVPTKDDRTAALKLIRTGADGKFDIGFVPTAALPPSPSGTVAAETSFGVSSSAGAATTYARGDHTHGTPTNPVPAHVAATDPHGDRAYADGIVATEAAARATDVDTEEAARIAADAAHVAAADPHTGYQKESEKDAAGGYAGLDGSSKLTGSQQKYGSSANTACEGNDSRLSDSRAPTGSAGGDLTGTYPNPTVAKITEASGPTTLTIGTVADGEYLKRSGSTLVSAAPAVVLPGSIIMAGFAGTPSGYLTCDGTAVSRSTYADLFSAIGTVWGAGDGSTTFNVPDLRDRFPQAQGGSNGIATTGGAVSPSVSDPGHTHTIATANRAGVATPTSAASVTGSSTTGITIPDGRPPYATVAFFIKT